MIIGPSQNIADLLFNAEHADAFIEAYEKSKTSLTLDVLRTKAQDGSFKGKSVLWQLAGAAADGHPQAFLAVWDKFKNNITLDDLHAKAESEPHKGQTVLWCLAGAAANGHPQAFLAVWDKFKNDITLDDLRAKAESGTSKGKSVLWQLAAAHPQAFLAVWDKFKNNITLDDDLRVKALEGFNKGQTVLWLLAVAAANKHPEAFLAIWDKFINDITLDDLRAKAESGTNKGQTVLWWLAVAAAKGHPQAFLAVWDKFKNDITIDEDLRVKALEGTNKGKSVLWLIAQSSFDVRYKLLNDIFENILTQASSKLNEQVLTEKFQDNIPSIAELIQRCVDVSWRQYIQNLIAARNALFAAIEAQQMKASLEEQDIRALSELAKNASAAGYVNAFYDIGLLFFQKGNPAAACTAFKKLPSHAKQFTSANSQAAATLLGQAMLEKNDNERQERLEHALWFALRLENNEAKVLLMNQIAYCHVTQGKGTDLETVYFIKSDDLTCLNDNAPLKNYFRLFEKLFKLARLESVVEKGETAPNKSYPELTASYTPSYNRDPQPLAFPQETRIQPRRLGKKNTSKLNRG